MVYPGVGKCGVAFEPAKTSWPFSWKPPAGQRRNQDQRTQPASPQAIWEEGFTYNCSSFSMTVTIGDPTEGVSLAFHFTYNSAFEWRRSRLSVTNHLGMLFNAVHYVG